LEEMAKIEDLHNTEKTNLRGTAALIGFN